MLNTYVHNYVFNVNYRLASSCHLRLSFSDACGQRMSLSLIGPLTVIIRPMFPNVTISPTVSQLV